jgi:hypothetical protein
MVSLEDYVCFLWLLFIGPEVILKVLWFAVFFEYIGQNAK